MNEKSFFTDVIAALDAMPKKALITDKYEFKCEFCTLGAWGDAQSWDLREIRMDHISEMEGISLDVLDELVKENDGFCGGKEGRWVHMRNYVQSKLDKLVDEELT